MSLSIDNIQAIKTVALEKKVTVFMVDGHVISGVMKGVTTDTVRLESEYDVSYLMTSGIIGIRINK